MTGIFKIISVSVCGIALVLITFLCEAAAQETAAPDEPGISSVLVRLQSDKDEFETFMSKTLAPELQKIGESFQKNIQRAETLLEQLRKDPQNQKLRAQYEDSLSAAIAQASTILDDFTKQQGATFKAMDSVSKTIEDAQQAFQAEVAEGSKRVDEFAKQATSARTRLSDLAQKYQSQLQTGKPLPEDVDVDVRLMEADLEISAANEKIAKLAVADAEQAVGELRTQTRDLKKLRGDLQVAFRQGQGQQMLLANLANVKRARLQGSQVYERLAAVRKVVAARKTDLSQIGKLVDRIMEKDLADARATRKTTETASVAQPSADILKAYLPKEKKGDESREAKK